MQYHSESQIGTRLLSNARRTVSLYEEPSAVANMPAEELVRQHRRFQSARLQAIHASPFLG